MDFAPAFFSLCAFLVGVMWIDTIAGEVSRGAERGAGRGECTGLIPLCAFLVGVMWTDAIAGEVSRVGITAAGLISISGAGGEAYTKGRLPHSRIAHA